MASRSIIAKAPKLGTKQIFLPNFEIILLNNPKIPPTFAAFEVPLNFNKLDLRDYLWNGYGVSVRGVRSYIQMQKVRQDKPGAARPSPRKWFRPRSIKKMMVELEQPFVWPEAPENFEDWDKERHDAVKEMQKQNQQAQHPDSRLEPTKERKSIAAQASKYLSGKKQWSSTWEDIGELKEVEQDMKV